MPKRRRDGLLIAALMIGAFRAAVAPAVAGAPAAGATPVAARDTSLRWTSTIFATSRDLPNPVAFSIDERGVVYTANTLRYGGHGMFDLRAFPILRDDWTIRTLDDRRRLMERWIAERRLDHDGEHVTADWLSRFSEQIRRLEDTDGDGRADRTTTFAEGMNEPVRGAAAGVLAWDGRVYATVIPELLMFADSAGGGRATSRRVLQDGFGLHMGLTGHDMHGLTIGNDGRLYWSIADRGFRFTTAEGRAFEGHDGAVFRCWPDGSGLELFARGLRNPQELAFDEHGDLFTGDNNSDAGDRARLVWLPRDSDAGWNYFLQSLPDRGPWLREHMWEKLADPRDPAQPAWVNLPVDYVESCPAGMCAYPGTGLPPGYEGTLWLTDFLAGVQCLRVTSRGAGFSLSRPEVAYREAWGMDDAEFGYDGRLYVLYWGEGWQPSDKARLVALAPRAEGIDTTAVREVRELFRGGFAQLSGERLAALLGHTDRRVRQRASFELARRGDLRRLASAASDAPLPLARMHALWGLGIAGHGRGWDAVSAALEGALDDRDAEVRRVAATMTGELDRRGAIPRLVRMLEDRSPRAVFAAAQALGLMGAREATPALERALALNDDADAALRFALSQALARTAGEDELARLSAHALRPVRLGAVLALRRAGSERVADFLDDAETQVALEAARAAYDLRLPGAMAALAARLPDMRADLRIEPFVRRALYAALITGGDAPAERVARFAADTTTEESWRTEAIRVLAAWDHPDDRDGVWGIWGPLPPRTPGAARPAIAENMNALLAGARGAALAEAMQLAQREHVPVANEVLLRWVRDETQNDLARRYALGMLRARRAGEFPAALDAALGSRRDSLFGDAIALELARDPARGTATIERVLASPRSPLALRQMALRSLGRGRSPEALARHVADAAAGRMDPALVLDAVESAQGSRANAATLSPAAGPRARAAWFAPTLEGGDARRGRAVFESHTAAQCVRCHALDGRGGTAGPDLGEAGAHSRRELLEALTNPSATFAKGYEFVTLTLAGGERVSGWVSAEDSSQVMLNTGDAPRAIARVTIRARERGQSPMPPMGALLSRHELRDVIEFLSTCRSFQPEAPLDSLRAESVSTATGAVGTGRSCGGNPLRVAGREFRSGFGVHAPSRVVYPIPAGARAFVASVGLDDEVPSGLAIFVVRIDGIEEWRSEPLKRGSLHRVFAAIPAGARSIELIVDDAGNGNANDHADWIEPGFLADQPRR